MLRDCYNWMLRMAESRYALPILALVSFVESSVFPIPPDVMLLPMILAAPHRAWLIAGVCTIASVLGGAFGYYVGAELFDVIGAPVLEFYGKMEKFDHFSDWFAQYGSWAVLVAGITPFPYKVITIASGAVALDFGTFMISSIIARGLRFFIIAALLWRYGAPIRDFIEHRLGLVFSVLMAALIGGFVALKFI
ncbi:YqaA family protein [Paracoccaceae bacterium GXU_MW_L88]